MSAELAPGAAPDMSTGLSGAAEAGLRGLLRLLYPAHDAEGLLARVRGLVAAYQVECQVRGRVNEPRDEPFDQRDVLLITYADQVSEAQRAPLATLHEFLTRRFADTVTGVHLLPFFPSTSDDGFAVADYLAVDPAVGRWDDVRRIGRDFRLMVDAVFNHTSVSSPWFQAWRAGEPSYADFYLTADPDSDVSAVTRPRSHPLLTRFETVMGERWVWTTFSNDQVDLDYGNPEVLLAVTEVLLTYIAAGAGIIRLDAVAFLSKELGTNCVHLANTHRIVQFWRALVDAAAPGTLLITETNVPHQENVSYFGDGANEAHAVYQFPLAPLVLSAFHLADASTLTDWAAGLSTPSPQTTFLNFLGSHDGIGVRPAEGLLTQAEIQQLVKLASAHGGGVSYRTNPDGSLSPYELNTVFFDALTEADSMEPVEVQVQRFMSAQSILLSMAGVPAIYVQGLLGSRNWIEGVKQAGHLRAINRRKYALAELEAALDDPASLPHQVSTRLSARIRTRAAEPAFHPNGAQRVLRGGPGLFAFEREAPDGSRAVVCVHSLSGRAQEVALGPEQGLTLTGAFHDLCAERSVTTDADGVLRFTLEPYGVAWLAHR